MSISGELSPESTHNNRVQPVLLVSIGDDTFGDELLYSGGGWLIPARNSSGISTWEASEDSFPQLETLVIEKCSELKEIPLSFAAITTLKQIKLLYSKRSLKDSGEKIKKEVEENEGYDRINLITIGV
ncbi:hypothetical protein FXO38_00972, partial [Capsicum annuum]